MKLIFYIKNILQFSPTIFPPKIIGCGLVGQNCFSEKQSKFFFIFKFDFVPKNYFNFILKKLIIGKVQVCLDTACDTLCDFWDRETERNLAEKMDFAARSIEKIWYRAKACRRIEWMRNNGKLLRTKKDF